MSYPKPSASLRNLDAALAEDLRRDIGAETLFFICAVEAALEIDFLAGDAEAESAQPGADILDEAA